MARTSADAISPSTKPSREPTAVVVVVAVTVVDVVAIVVVTAVVAVIAITIVTSANHAGKIFAAATPSRAICDLIHRAGASPRPLYSLFPRRWNYLQRQPVI